MMNFLLAFLIGGAICVIGQLLMDLTNLTPARIMVGFVVAGVVLGAAGVYDWFLSFAGAGASVPLLGFGNVIAGGVKKAVQEQGALGIFTGPLTAAAGGVAAAVCFGWLGALLSQARAK